MRTKANKINTIHEFVVEGSHDFPFDMLRYDACWPRTQEDTPKVGYRPRGKSAPKRQVTLVSHKAPTPDRWASFGWDVVKLGTRSIA